MKQCLALPILVLLLVACEANTITDVPLPATAVPLQAVLTAVLPIFGDCRSYQGGGGELPEVITEERPEGPSASFTCTHSADTNYSVSISSSDREAIPANQFTAEQADWEGKCFHGYVLYEETSTSPAKQYIVRESQEWQAQHWVVSIDASYDYGYVHYTAQQFSEAIYASGVDQGLFPAGTCP